MLAELLNLNIFAFLLIFSRVGTAMSLFPGFSAGYITVRARVALAAAVCFVLTFAIGADLPVMPDTVGEMSVLVGSEILIGAFFGMLGRIAISSLQTAGTLIALYSSMANALIQDPLVEQQSSTISGFLSMVGLVLIFATDLHHLMLVSVIDSYTLFDPGAPVPVGDFSGVVLRKIAKAFALGLQMAAPFILTVIAYYVGLGLLGRLMPTLQVFFIGMPAQIMAQISMLAIVLSSIMLLFLQFYEDTFEAFLGP